MKTQLIAAALVCATAALSSPAFAQNDAASGAGFGRSRAALHFQRTETFRRAHNQARIEPVFFTDGWIGAGAFDRSRVGTIDPDLRPSAN
jgi:hypothetical protein